ncbi:MAG TPA: DUF4923 family protein [Candidatus Parabacteroides intestinavium]|nr:DUF4923 family protein [Candidatus Parabacteroides intestinavium]
MKKFILCAGLLSLACLCPQIQAQSLKDILKSSAVKDAVTSLTGGKELTAANLSGTWEYVSPAVMLEGDNALKNVAGNVAASEVEKKLQSYCDKIGLKAGTFSYTFNDDNTFTCIFKEKTLKGTYTLQESDKTIQLKYGNLKIANISAQVVLTHDELALLFNADKLLDFLGTLSSLSGSTTLQAINKLTDQYEGFKVGFQLKK